MSSKLTYKFHAILLFYKVYQSLVTRLVSLTHAGPFQGPQLSSSACSSVDMGHFCPFILLLEVCVPAERNTCPCKVSPLVHSQGMWLYSWLHPEDHLLFCQPCCGGGWSHWQRQWEESCGNLRPKSPELLYQQPYAHSPWHTGLF